MDLVYRNVYGEDGKATTTTLALLYAHLAERPREANISHMSMPPWEVHKAFVQGQPYAAWWLIYARVPEEACIGNAYITRAREIGIAVDEAYRRQGAATEIISKLIEMHQPRGPFFANVAPDNKASHALFASLGFRPVQLTYRIDPVFFDEPLYPGHPQANQPVLPTHGFPPKAPEDRKPDESVMTPEARQNYIDHSGGPGRRKADQSNPEPQTEALREREKAGAGAPEFEAGEKECETPARGD